MRLSLRAIRAGAIGLLIFVLGWGGGSWWGAGHKLSFAFSDGKPTFLVLNRSLPADKQALDFSLFWEVWDRVHQDYVNPQDISDEALVYGAIKGMTAAVGDPYTVFLPPKDNEESMGELNGEFEGVGIQLGFIDGQLGVIAPLEGTPAQRAGVKAGDLILRIVDAKNGVDVETGGMNLQRAVNLIRGPEGTQVVLTLFRESKGDFEVSMDREKILVPSVKLTIGRWEGEKFVDDANGEVAYLQLYRFGDRTVDEWGESVRTILSRKGQIRGIVLDLRNNPGGYLQGAIDIASDFISDGVVVKRASRTEEESFTVSGKTRLSGVPVVVLINKGSASASEILAGALRDRLQVKLVGEKSFGKGTIQDVIELRNRSGLHVTVAGWLLPSGVSIAKEGLTPDVQVKEPEVKPGDDVDKLVDEQLKRAVELVVSGQQ